MSKNQTVKLRFCPSPTGRMHLGNTRTALFNALYAHGQQGVFLLRIEDTDQSRSKREYADLLMSDLRWLGMDWQEGAEVEGDNGPYWQSQRQPIYDSFYQTLIDKGLAYPCFCSEEKLAITRKVQRAAGKPPRYPGTCRHLSAEEVAAKEAEGLQATLRFRMPSNDVIEFTDTVKGLQRFQTDDIGDFIIRRTDGTAPFMYCNAIDDALMGVTHVMRGEDHLTNTPRQIMILQALELAVPQYGHISLILGDDGAPLSKRNGSKSVVELREQGYLPSAINNYLARLGHFYENTEFMSMDELSAQFDLSKLSSSPARYDASQLDYWQKLAVAELTDEAFAEWVKEYITAIDNAEQQALFIATIRPNCVFPKDAQHWDEMMNAQQLTFDADMLNVLQSAGEAFFVQALAAAAETSEFKSIANSVKEQLGVKGKQLFQPLRVALTGQLHGPEMANIVKLLGTEKVQQRFQQVLAILHK